MRCAPGYEEQVRVSQISAGVEHREFQVGVVKWRAIGGYEHEQAAGDLGQQVSEHDARPAHPCGRCGLHIVFLPLHQNVLAHQPGVGYPAEYDHGQDTGWDCPTQKRGPAHKKIGKAILLPGDQATQHDGQSSAPVNQPQSRRQVRCRPRRAKASGLR